MKTLKYAVLSVAVMVMAVQVQAAQQTNLVQTLSIQLYGVSQGGPFNFGGTSGTNINSVRVDTRQVIVALGTATGKTFSFASRLVIVSPVDGGSAKIQVRDGSSAPVDVTSYFNAEEISGSVDGSVTTTRPRRSTTSVSYLISHFVLQDAGDVPLTLHFNVNGFTTINSTSGGFGTFGPVTDANVSGTGDRNGNLLILQGSIEIFGRTLEVVESGPILS